MPPPLAAASSSSSRCGPFTCRGDGSHHQRARAQAPAAAVSSGHRCGRPMVGRAAGLVGGGIAAAFFASLERCACLEVRTADDDCASGRDEAAPLMQLDGDGAGSRAAGRKSKKAASRAGAGAAKGRRGGGGFGCCENVN